MHLNRSFFFAAYVIVCVAVSSVSAGDAPTGAYRKTIEARAAKIVDPLKLDDEEKAGRVRRAVMQHYFNLNDWQQAHEEELRTLRKQGDSETAKDRIEAIEAVRREYHGVLLGRLKADLTPSQIDAIKDGMTYGVVKVTYDTYLEFVPDLSDAQKKMIMDNLVEAREKAVDGTSSKEKHAMFNKYKGRINNRLAADGIDMKKAEKDHAARNR